MILHLGSDCFVTKREIIMILDYEEAARNQDTSLFLSALPAAEACPGETPKSAVVVVEDGKAKLYLSPISSKTLWNRCGEKYIAAPAR